MEESSEAAAQYGVMMMQKLATQPLDKVSGWSWLVLAGY